jgi:hypothetical protein
LAARARRALEHGESVVVDASWNREVHRVAARAVAQSTSSELVEVRCTAPAEVAAERIRTRAQRYGSEATPAVASAMRAATDDWPAAVPVDTTGPAADVLAGVLRRLPPAR